MAAFWSGLWRLADPKISLASFASLFLGTCAAARDGGISWGWLAITVLGIFAIEVAKNASGEIFDLGTDGAVEPEDRSPFSGGKRVLVDHLLTRNQTIGISLRASGRSNWVVKLGRSKAARAFVGINTIAAIGLAVLPLAGLPRGVWLGGLFLIPTACACRILLRDPESTRQVIPAQSLTLLSFITYALGAGIGILLKS